MPFEIYPANVDVYPSDLVRLTVRTGQSPPLYRNSDNSTVNASYELVQTAAADFYGTLAQEVWDGICSASLTLTSDCIPDTGGDVQLLLFSYVSATFGVWAFVEPTQILVKDKNGTLKDTISHTAAAGDVIKCEVAGTTLRFYLNGTLETEFSEATASVFPVRCYVQGGEPFTTAGTPTLPPPVLVGQWETRPDGVVGSGHATWTIAGGTAPDVTDLWQIAYTAGTAPGDYTQSLQVGADAVQTTTATVTILPLTILEKTQLTIEAGSTRRFRTNYDNAQTAGLVTWSVVTVGGGSFDASGLYTAPTTPGSYTIRATSGAQQRDIVVVIENEITPDYEVVKTAEVVNWDSNMTGTLTWSASAGSINSTTGVWTAPSVDGQVVTITVTNGTDSESRIVRVLEAMPSDPSLTQAITYTRQILRSISEDGNVTGRVKTRDGKYPLVADLEFRNRDLTEFETFLDFWAEKYPHRSFIFEDKIRSTRHAVVFDGDIEANMLTDGAIDFSVRLREVL